MSDEHYLKRELYAQVREDSRIFEFLQGGSLDGVWYWDLERPEHEWMSPRFWQALGVDPRDKQHLASEWQDLINHDDLAVALENFKRHCDDPNHPYDQIVRYRHADGSTVWIRCRGLAIRDADGKPVRMLGAHTDVTRLKVAEAELAKRVADATSRELVANLPLALIIVTPRGEIDFLNGAAERLLGYTRDELTGQHITTVIPGARSEQRAEFIETYYRAPRDRHAEVGRDIAVRRKDGAWVPVEVGLAPVNNASGSRTVASLIDLTERKEHERRLKRSNRDLERFAYVTSHDLQAPLRQVVSFARLLQDSLRDQLSEEAKQDFQFLIGATKRMQGMIKAILTFSRLHSDKPRSEPVALAEVVATVREALAVEIEEAGATVTVDPLPTINGAQAHFLMLFQNLLANAVKFRSPARALTIHVGAERSDSGWRVFVADNGIGFAPQYAEEVFQIFRRLESREAYEGTGIGLALARRIVEEHGGRVWAEAARGVGAKFFIEWPAPTAGGGDETP